MSVVVVSIYALRDPVTRSVRYVGRSFNPRGRFISHMAGSRRDNPGKRAWIQALKQRGDKPLMEILAKVGPDDACRAEQEWIGHFAGPELFNASPGRPPGVARPHKVFTYLNDEELEQLHKLAQEQTGSVAAALRLAMVREYKRKQERENGDG